MLIAGINCCLPLLLLAALLVATTKQDWLTVGLMRIHLPALSVFLASPAGRTVARSILVGGCAAWSIAFAYAPARAQQVPLLHPCAASDRPWPAEDEPQQRFDRALSDAGVLEECERWDALEPMTPANPDLIWDSTGKRVLMVTWLSVDMDVSSLPVGVATPSPGLLWAVPVASIRSMIERELLKKATTSSQDPGSPPQLSLNVVDRTREYLGLRPDSRYVAFLEFWVSPADLIRPCIGGAVGDTRCTLRKPGSGPSAFLERPAAYSVNGFPFTGLGYTYDWGNPTTEIGASEFVVEPGKEIKVFRVVPNQKYLSCGAIETFAPLTVSVRRDC